MANLITISDFADYRAISTNVNDVKRLDPYIAEAQEFDLKALLGQYLYDDFVKNITNTIYQSLLNGKEYTDTSGYNVIYKGIKPVLVYYAYSRFLANDNIKSTASGFVIKRQDEYSEPISEKTMSRLIQQAESSALSYFEGVKKFLNDNYSIYPLWKYCGINTNKRSGCNISSVGGNQCI